jgi:gas vesicle protein
MNSSKVLLGVLGGIAAGALVGVLFAPEKGIKTRKKIIGKVKDSKDALKNKSNSLLKSANQKYENIWEAKEQLLTEGEAKLEAVKKDFKNL